MSALYPRVLTPSLHTSLGHVMMRGKWSFLLRVPLTMASMMLGWSEPKFTKQWLTPASHRASKKASDVVYMSGGVAVVAKPLPLELMGSKEAQLVCLMFGRRVLSTALESWTCRESCCEEHRTSASLSAASTTPRLEARAAGDRENQVLPRLPEPARLSSHCRFREVRSAV